MKLLKKIRKTTTINKYAIIERHSSVGIDNFASVCFEMHVEKILKKLGGIQNGKTKLFIHCTVSLHCPRRGHTHQVYYRFFRFVPDRGLPTGHTNYRNTAHGPKR